MILATMLFTAAMGVLLAVAAMAMEKARLALHKSTRFVWIVAMGASVTVPVLVVEQGTVGPPPALEASIGEAETAVSGDFFEVSEGQTPAQSRWVSWPTEADWDRPLLLFWGATSLVVVLIYLIAWRRLRHQVSSWKRATLNGTDVRVSQRFGPAVFGWLHPAIVIPEWVLLENQTLQQNILTHEVEHLRARDQMIVMLGFLFAAIAPWSPAMWWQLVRLRFAIEVDCDSRLVRRGLDRAEYGEALLAVAQVRSVAPLWVVALIERRSHLEKRIRIMLSQGNGRRRLRALLYSLVGVGVASAAWALDTPVRDSNVPLKPPPVYSETPSWIRAAETLLVEQYSELTKENLPGTPILTILFSSDGLVERSEYEVFEGKARQFAVGDDHYGGFGIASAEIGPILSTTMVFAWDKTNEILVLAAERLGNSTSSLYPAFPGTEALDQELFEHYFPDAFRGGAQKNPRPWLLFDREGTVIRSGWEPHEVESVRSAVEGRFPGVLVQEVLTSQVTRSRNDGAPLELYSLWLAPDSAVP